MDGNEKAAPGWPPVAALVCHHDNDDDIRADAAVQVAHDREVAALTMLKDAISALGLPPGVEVALFACASSYGKAHAARVIAERNVS